MQYVAQTKTIEGVIFHYADLESHKTESLYYTMSQLTDDDIAKMEV